MRGGGRTLHLNGLDRPIVIVYNCIPARSLYCIWPVACYTGVPPKKLQPEDPTSKDSQCYRCHQLSAVASCGGAGIMSNIPTFKFAFVFFMVTSSWTLLSILTAVAFWKQLDMVMWWLSHNRNHYCLLIVCYKILDACLSTELYCVIVRQYNICVFELCIYWHRYVSLLFLSSFTSVKLKPT